MKDVTPILHLSRNRHFDCSCSSFLFPNMLSKSPLLLETNLSLKYRYPSLSVVICSKSCSLRISCPCVGLLYSPASARARIPCMFAMPRMPFSCLYSSSHSPLHPRFDSLNPFLELVLQGSAQRPPPPGSPELKALIFPSLRGKPQSQSFLSCPFLRGAFIWLKDAHRPPLWRASEEALYQL